MSFLLINFIFFVLINKTHTIHKYFSQTFWNIVRVKDQYVLAFYHLFVLLFLKRYLIINHIY